MPTANKISKKELKTANFAVKTISAEKYFQGIGRRKLSMARVKIFVSSAKKEAKTEPEIVVNGKPYKEYFTLLELKEIVGSPLKAVSSDGISRCFGCRARRRNPGAGGIREIRHCESLSSQRSGIQKNT